MEGSGGLVLSLGGQVDLAFLEDSVLEEKRLGDDLDDLDDSRGWSSRTGSVTDEGLQYYDC